MPIFTTPIPLGLYVHIPWCVRKCPYCDFNSHEAKNTLPEKEYVEALLDELDRHQELIGNRSLVSIFFGGGTPSLFSAQSIERILQGINKRLSLDKKIEITLEANPGTIDQVRFKDFFHAGINRISLGIQSLQNDKLKILGRIHDRDHALQAIKIAQTAGFDNINLDLMYGLPSQSITDALEDIKTALDFGTTHFSWYQLTIEPNTLFYRQTPILPLDDTIWDMQLAGQQLIQECGFQQYEVSAYAKSKKECRHNLNYWQFGDYLGIGAGAHSKITHQEKVLRFAQVKNPRDYLNVEKRRALQFKSVTDKDLIFEFMLNALRLTTGVPAELFSERTGLSKQTIQPILCKAKERGLLLDDAKQIYPSALGKRYLNDLVAMFLD